MMKNVPCRTNVGLLLAIAASLLTSAAHAQDSSPWAKDAHASARLLAGSRSGQLMLGGIDLDLQPGWKTYWRTPGDSGVPPRFDFSKSENVEAVTILWPAPAKFEDGSGGFSFGYKTRVVLPLRIVAKDPDQPLTLRVDINYAVCEKLCVPVEASLALPFTSVASTEDSSLAKALDTVPKPAAIGGNTPLTIRDFKRSGSKTVLVDVMAAQPSHADLFVEGPSPEWSLPVPKIIAGEGKGTQRFSFDLEGLPPDAKPERAALKMTLVSKDAAYEFNVNLD